MKPRTRLPAITATLALTAGLALSGCGGGVQPSGAGTTPPSTAATSSHSTTATSPIPTSSGSSAGLRGILGAFPEPPIVPASAAVDQKFQATLDGLLEAHAGLRSASPGGITAAVLAPGCGVWAGAAGHRVDGEPMTTDTQFLMASVTKSLTAAAVLRLAEEGRVDIDVPVATYLPADLKVNTNGATVRQLLAMRSGLADFDQGALDEAALAKPNVAMDHAAVLAMMPTPAREANKQTEYVDTNYVLLGYVIEGASGQSVAQALRTLVFPDHGLDRLVFEDQEQPQGPLAAAYVDPARPVARLQATLDEAFGDGFIPTRSLASRAWTAGAAVSDAPTLARWGYLLFGGWVVSQEGLAQMADLDEGDLPYGMGVHDLSWPPFPGEALSTGIGHEGWDMGYRATLLVRPESGVIVAALMNDERIQGFWATPGKLADIAESCR